MRHACVVFTALLLFACTAKADTQNFPNSFGGPFALKVSSIKEARFQATMRQQFDFSCGSAALATLLTHHYGTPTTEQSAFETMFLNGDQPKIRQEGFSLLDMKRYLQARGFLADGFEASLDELVNASTPAIALISEKGYNHFVVVKGMQDDRVLIGDPATGRRTMSRAAFESLWQTRVLFLIHDTKQKAVFNDATEWRMAPAAPLTAGVNRANFAATMLARRGPGDY